MRPGDAVEVGQGEGDRVNAVIVAAGVTADVDPGVSAQRPGDFLEVPGSARVVDLDAEPVNGELADDDLTAVADVAEAAHELQHLLVQPGGVEAAGDAVVEVEADEAAGMQLGGDGVEVGVIGTVIPVGGARAAGEAF
jgi:hypothetical protein